MEILIAGDSWGKGEWGPDSQVQHPGVAAYLEQDGHRVHNVSQAGASNLDIVFRLRNYLDRYRGNLPSHMLVFQTEHTRDHKHDAMQQDFGTDDWQHLEHASDLSSRWIERFYLRLSELSLEYNIPVMIVGGCGDAMWFDHMERDYPGCSILCQSVTNLLINQQHRIAIPVHSWYMPVTESLIAQLKKVLSDHEFAVLLDDVNRGFERECLLREHPELFYPDGRHPNRYGHRLLYEFIKANNFQTPL